MTARTTPQQPATDAIPVFNGQLFDEKCKELGATTEKDRAALVGSDISTLHRFRNGLMGPRLTVARRFARRLKVQVDDLWPTS